MVRARLLVLVPFLACAHPAAVRYEGAASPSLRRDVDDGRRRVAAFFGADFPRPFTVSVFPDRAAFTARMRIVLHAPDFQSECWMVGVGNGQGLALLAPERWAAEACEHDASDARQVANLVAHELVHVYHAQANPRLDTDDAAFEPLAWFVEGLATYVSGQLEDGHLASADEARALGKGPASLAAAWSGKYKYGVSGSLVAFVDRRFGRAAILRMLRASSQEELLAPLGVGEQELLTAWNARP